MNINAINNQLFQGKMPKEPLSRIKIIGDVNGYIEQRIADGSNLIGNTAKLYNKEVKLAQKGDLLLINSGTKTTAFNWKQIENPKELYDSIINNIRENGKIIL